MVGGDLHEYSCRKIHVHVIHLPARECCGSGLFSYETSEDPDQLARNQKIIYIVYTETTCKMHSESFKEQDS